MSQIDNILIQVRALLQQNGVKLWLEPYYVEDFGAIEPEIERLADEFSQTLGISASNCKMALTELQDGALRKLETRKAFEETGVATFSIRRVNNEQGTQSISEVKCPMNALGRDLHAAIAKKLELGDSSRVKCISRGKIIDSQQTLVAQGLQNNQQVMVIISPIDPSQSDSKEAMYDRIRKIKMDVEALVNSDRQYFEMEDQDGNPVFLPPSENRALLLAMGFCEKARAALKRGHYDEALILYLEADEKFSNCDSKFLENVDNYALVNLDIVWCYLCLKNIGMLPDAERRLRICEDSFRRSYGENNQRLIALKGNNCPERALIMRLHLLQGVILFHQNRRNEAYEKLHLASSELKELKVDEDAVVMFMEMGFTPLEARLGLRSSGGDVESAINFIQERNAQLAETRKQAENERRVNKKLRSTNKDKHWVNPRSVTTLIEMGFPSKLVVAALKRTKNDVPRALDLLQTHSDELQGQVSPVQEADSNLLEQLQQLGFDENMCRVALETNSNNLDSAIDFLLKLFKSENELTDVIGKFAQSALQPVDAPGPSTSRAASELISKALEKAKNELESLKAYERFNEDVADNELDYLDLPLVQEEQLVAEYIALLER